MMKKILCFAMVMVMVLTAFTGCGKKNDTQTKDDGDTKKLQKLVVGMMPFGGNVPAKYAFDKKYFEAAGLDVEFVMFANGAGINEALAAEQVDMAVSGLAMVFSLASGTSTWIGETNNSGGMGIYVRPDSPILATKGQIEGKPNMYGTAETIKGLKVLGQLGTSSQYNVICYARQFGLTEADVEMVNIDMGTDLQTFISGEGDAFAASRPYSFQAEDQGYVCAATFEDATDIVLKDGIVARNDMLKSKRDEMVIFLREYYKAAAELQKDEKLRFDVSKAYFAENGRSYSDNDMNNEMRVQNYITADTMKESGYLLGDAMLDISKFYSEGGKITAENLPNVPASFDTSLLKDALEIDVTAAK